MNPDRFDVWRSYDQWFVRARIDRVWQIWAGPYRHRQSAHAVQERYRQLWGITWRPSHEKRKHGPDRKEIPLELLRDVLIFRQNGTSLREIGNRLGVSKTTAFKLEQRARELTRAILRSGWGDSALASINRADGAIEEVPMK